jgi:hypothetical protein
MRLFGHSCCVRLRNLAGTGLILAATACAAPREASAVTQVGAPLSAPVHFAYPTVDGRGMLATGTLAGRTSVLAFVATYDMASQAQARFLGIVQHRREPRVNVAAIVLEPLENRPLILAFRDALRLDYPMAIGDAELIAGGGPFGDVHGVPTVLVLDAEGRIIWKHVGLAKDAEIDEALRGK